MQKTTQGRINAHLQRAAELLSFGTNAGDKLKLQTVDQKNKPMTLWIQIHEDAVSREKQKWWNRYNRPANSKDDFFDNYFGEIFFIKDS